MIYWFALAWLIMALTVISYIVVRYFDKYFWKGVGYGLLISICWVLTICSLIAVIEGSK